MWPRRMYRGIQRRIIHYFCAVSPRVFCCLRKTKLRSKCSARLRIAWRTDSRKSKGFRVRFLPAHCHGALEVANCLLGISLLLSRPRIVDSYLKRDAIAIFIFRLIHRHAQLNAIIKALKFALLIPTHPLFL